MALQVIDMLLEKLPEIVAEEGEGAGDVAEGSFSQVSSADSDSAPSPPLPSPA